ncbi:hypothetical protein VK792_06295 [Mesobacterium sp. TK19101]|uniref:Argininosuccinate lyase n=1 Tax=Mesobacterium hydrothermale TaxID=3111907 RepID=A0ABU6HEK8_9RHOB|nr:hypothetical protein [Mesobacterium sp. TK19101]MEC3860887.1 hypothetical protein [Mesobacterium sp. TK19101]
MKQIAAALILTLLAGCGADGPPIRPSVNTSVRVTPNGVSTATGVSVQSGPVTVGVAL